MRWCKWVALTALVLVSSCGKGTLPDVDLGSVLLQSDDLPSELAEGSMKTIEPRTDLFGDHQAVEQEIVAKDGDHIVGTVTVYLFRSATGRDQAYDLVSLMESQEGIIPYDLPSIGDRVSARHTDDGRIVVVFVRCNAVAVFVLEETGVYQFSKEDVVKLAKRLDQRLMSALCP
jgi:hypothetical protein